MFSLSFFSPFYSSFLPASVSPSNIYLPKLQKNPPGTTLVYQSVLAQPVSRSKAESSYQSLLSFPDRPMAGLGRAVASICLPILFFPSEFWPTLSPLSPWSCDLSFLGIICDSKLMDRVNSGTGMFRKNFEYETAACPSFQLRSGGERYL